MWAAEARGIEAFEKQLYLEVRSKARRGCENSFVGGGGRGSRGMGGAGQGTARRVCSASWDPSDFLMV